MEGSHYFEEVNGILSSVRERTLSVEERRELAIELAAGMLNEARMRQSSQERRQQAQLGRMMGDPKGKIFTIAITDQCFRSSKAGRISDQISYLLGKYGIPRYLNAEKRLALKAFQWMSSSAGPFLIPFVKSQLRSEVSAVILPGEEDMLKQHIMKRHKEGLRVNLNRIGEAILGEGEAIRRLELYLSDLKRPEVEYISVKISSICSQINLLAWEDTLAILSERLKRLYREAAQHEFIQPCGRHVPKFVNLDMEEYRDLHLTVELFKRTLDDPEFFHQYAGIVLQSYLPDSYLIQQQLTVWAMQRVASGGAPIKIRIVKGANLAMEKVEASIHNWTVAPYGSKTDVDANFKRLVNYATEPDHAKAAHIGVGSHNLFDIAYVMLLREERGVQKYVGFEMLEGMANPMRRVVHELSGDMLVYCPAAKREEFQNALAYLIRRLDENTAPKNFLHHAFGLIPGTKEWHKQASYFSLACHAANAVSKDPRRQQGRFKEPRIPNPSDPFVNEPDTDWTLPDNRRYAETIVREWKERTFEQLPIVVAGKSTVDSKRCATGTDPSRPGFPLYHYTLGDEAALHKAIKSAKKAQVKWGKLTAAERAEFLIDAAKKLRERRGDLIGVMLADGGKLIPEADTEVSEAIDFAEYYRRQIVELESLDEIEWTPKGVVCVAPPWNFPCAIPLGGIFAALVAGNSVIFKPAEECVLTAWFAVNALWDAGISKELVQFFPCADEPVGSALIGHEDVNAVILTGSDETAKLMKKIRPSLDLMAETGGKNAMIVTDLADWDLAVMHITQSAFGHAGQKCSACSLLICLPEVYHSKKFRVHLKDAAESLRVGSSWDLATRVNPLIREPGEALKRGLTELEKGEEWLLEPKFDSENPQLISPGIKLGVKPGSFSHQTEFFGPVLSVICAENLDDAIRIANGTPYGLTSGLQSLDEREHAVWKEKIIAGNLYINRGITGAVVLRQPFGGCKASNFGRGLKPGGPNYLVQMMQAKQLALPSDRQTPPSPVKVLTGHLIEQGISGEALELWKGSIGSYMYHWKQLFSKESDPFTLLGQSNTHSYKPRQRMTLRIQEGDSLVDLFRVIAACVICSVPLEISGKDLSTIQNSDWIKLIRNLAVMEESDEQFVERMKQAAISCCRFVSAPTEAAILAASETMTLLIAEPVLANGRLELLHYLREVSLSFDYHRYGNLMKY